MSAAAPSGEQTPAKTFSYAQAARGKPPAPSRPSASTSGVVTPSKDGATVADSNSQASSHNETEAIKATSNEDKVKSQSSATESKDIPQPSHAAEVPKLSTTFSQTHEDDVKPQNIPLPLTPHLKPSSSLPNDTTKESSSQTPSAIKAPIIDKQPTPTSAPAEATSINATAEKSDSEKQADQPNHASTEASTTQKPVEEKGEKDKGLVPAPIPAVNFWQQRAKEAKSKAMVPGPSTSNTHTQNATGNGTKSVVNEGKSGNPDTDPVADPKSKASKPATNGNDLEKVTNPHASQNSLKGNKKSADPKTRDENLKRSTGRGKPNEGKEHEQGVHLAPPPVGDEALWPTPETAQDSDKRKSQDRSPRAEKEKAQEPSSRPHGGQKWISVNYTPTAVFNTPLPARRGGGGRPGRGGKDIGGRGTHTTSGAPSERTGAVAGGQSTQFEATERGRNESGQSRATSLPPKSGRRSNSMGHREQRRHVTPTLAGDKRPDENFSAARDMDPKESTAPFQRRTSIAQSESRYRSNQERRHSGRYEAYPSNSQSHSGAERYEKNQGSAFDGNSYGRSGSERRRDNYNSASESNRETGIQGHQNSRGGPDRSRGGSHRSRGGHNGYPAAHSFGGQPQFSNGQSSQPVSAPPFSPTRSQQMGFGTSSSNPSYAGSQRSSRGPRDTRDPSRSQSIPHSAGYGQFPREVYGYAHGIPPLQTALEPYDYRLHPASAGPPPHVADMATINMTAKQLAYYFSVDNLCKDMYLRKNMDSQGFVLLSLITNFNRIRLICTDASLLPTALMYASNEVEWVQGHDGVERLRRRNGWEQFVLDKAERDEPARNDGPEGYVQAFDPRMFPDRRFVHQPEMGYFDPMYAGYGMMPGYPPNMANEPGMHGPPREEVNFTQTPLSAAVPDFSPALPPVNGDQFSALDVPKVQDDLFTNDQINALRIVVKTPGSHKGESSSSHLAPSRTFSNGSIDSRSIAAEMNNEKLSTAWSPVNGVGRSPDASNGEPQPKPHNPIATPLTSPLKAPNGPSVLWIKDHSTDAGGLSEDSATVYYTEFRLKTLHERQNGPSEESANHLNILFEFWSHFLVRNFNNQMYHEFRELAYEDATQRNLNTGMKRLAEFYDACFLGKDVMSDALVHHYYELVKQENSTSGRPAFSKLRAAWRNGALNMKTRKKMDNFIDVSLKQELEG